MTHKDLPMVLMLFILSCGLLLGLAGAATPIQLQSYFSWTQTGAFSVGGTSGDHKLYVLGVQGSAATLLEVNSTLNFSRQVSIANNLDLTYYLLKTSPLAEYIYVIVAQPSRGFIYQIDASSFTIVTSLSFNYRVANAAFDPSGAYMYVTLAQANTMNMCKLRTSPFSIINCTNAALLSTKGASSVFWECAVTPDGSNWVCVDSGCMVWNVNTARLTLNSTFFLNASYCLGPSFLYAVGGYAYVTTFISGRAGLVEMPSGNLSISRFSVMSVAGESYKTSSLISSDKIALSFSEIYLIVDLPSMTAGPSSSAVYSYNLIIPLPEDFESKTFRRNNGSTYFASSTYYGDLQIHEIPFGQLYFTPIVYRDMFENSYNPYSTQQFYSLSDPNLILGVGPRTLNVLRTSDMTIIDTFNMTQFSPCSTSNGDVSPAGDDAVMVLCAYPGYIGVALVQVRPNIVNLTALTQLSMTYLTANPSNYIIYTAISADGNWLFTYSSGVFAATSLPEFYVENNLITNLKSPFKWDIIPNKMLSVLLGATTPTGSVCCNMTLVRMSPPMDVLQIVSIVGYSSCIDMRISPIYIYLVCTSSSGTYILRYDTTTLVQISATAIYLSGSGWKITTSIYDSNYLVLSSTTQAYGIQMVGSNFTTLWSTSSVNGNTYYVLPRNLLQQTSSITYSFSLPCPPRTRPSADGNNTCVACSRLSLNDSMCSIVCDPGRALSATGACISCPAGTFALIGALACVSCQPGTYTSNANSSQCLSCPRGTFAASTGAVSCSQCPAGSFSFDGLSCGLCDPGTFAPFSGSQCLDCAVGTYQPNSGQTSCFDCPIGTSSGYGSVTCVSCGGGYYRNETAFCRPCPGGTYQPDDISGNCSLECQPGNYSADGSIQCSFCPSSKYSDTNAAASCLPCVLGYNKMAMDDTFCGICAAGYETTDNVTCTACEEGYYKSNTGNVTCLYCDGTTTPPYRGGTSCAQFAAASSTGIDPVLTASTGLYTTGNAYTTQTRTQATNGYYATTGNSYSGNTYSNSYSSGLVTPSPTGDGTSVQVGTRFIIAIGCICVFFGVVLVVSAEVKIKRKDSQNKLIKAIEDARKDLANRKEGDLFIAKQRGIMDDLVSQAEDQGIIVKATKLRAIGLGNFGEVYRGLMGRTEVALKRVLAGGVTKDSVKAFEDLKKEIQALKNVQHKYVVRYYGLAVIEGDYWIVMDFMHFGPADKYFLENPGYFTDYTVIRVATHIAMGMVGLVEKRMVHCDLAARNVLIDKHGQAKLADFGQAVKRTAGQLTANLNDQKIALNWHPPEVISNRLFSEKSDVWSFGAFVYEMNTRQHPWKDSSADEIIYRVVDKREQLRIDFGPRWSEANALVQRCFAYDPADRPTFEELSMGLENICERFKVPI